jgi:folate-dependent phosphoribosylglycinamide formyltransferase PurN
MDKFNVVIVNSGDPSDMYFANRLGRRLAATAIIVERNGNASSFGRKLSKMAKLLANPRRIPGFLADRAIVSEHVRRSESIDRSGFGEDGYRIAVPGPCKVVEVSGKDILNSPETLRTLRSLDPDVFLLCGCSIVRGEFLAIPRYGTLNLHGGLSQRYRGVWTTLWAVVNEEPEYVGATVHFVSSGIDDGDIVYQGRPEIGIDDNPESLYVKVVKLGVEMMAAAVEDLRAGRVRRYPLAGKGSLYLSKMVTPAVLRKAWDLTDGGVISRYLADKERRDSEAVIGMQGQFRGGR